MKEIKRRVYSYWFSAELKCLLVSLIFHFSIITQLKNHKLKTTMQQRTDKIHPTVNTQ